MIKIRPKYDQVKQRVRKNKLPKIIIKRHKSLEPKKDSIMTQMVGFKMKSMTTVFKTSDKYLNAKISKRFKNIKPKLNALK